MDRHVRSDFYSLVVWIWWFERLSAILVKLKFIKLNCFMEYTVAQIERICHLFFTVNATMVKWCVHQILNVTLTVAMDLGQTGTLVLWHVVEEFKPEAGQFLL